MKIVSYRNISNPVELRALIDSILALVGELDLDSALNQVVKSAADLVGTKYGALGVLDDSGEGLSQFFPYGVSEEVKNSIGSLPQRHGLLGVMIKDLKPVRLSNVLQDRRHSGFPEGHPVMKSFLGVPIVIAGKAYGNLYLSDKLDGTDFNDSDEKLLEAFAKAASIIIEKAKLNERLKHLSVVEERERIARSLHDNVIQRLFAIGIKMQSKISQIEPEHLRNLFEDSVNEIDEVIHDIRKTIFAIDQSALLSGRDLLTEIDKIIENFEMSSDIRFTVTHSGNLNTILDGSKFDHIVCIAREVITNAVKHSRAKNVSVSVFISDEIELSVTDDGIGFDADKDYTGKGIKNIKTRASLSNGKLTIDRLNGKGTHVVFTVAAHEF
jgi:signal transduction histidine kinase